MNSQETKSLNKQKHETFIKTGKKTEQAHATINTSVAVANVLSPWNSEEEVPTI